MPNDDSIAEGDKAHARQVRSIMSSHVLDCRVERAILEYRLDFKDKDKAVARLDDSSAIFFLGNIEHGTFKNQLAQKRFQINVHVGGEGTFHTSDYQEPIFGVLACNSGGLSVSFDDLVWIDLTVRPDLYQGVKGYAERVATCLTARHSIKIGVLGMYDSWQPSSETKLWVNSATFSSAIPISTDI